MFKINFTGDDGGITRTITTTEIKTGKMDRIFELADEAKEAAEAGIRGITAWRKKIKALLVEIFHNQFTYDELQDGATNDEVMRCFNSILRGTGDAITKNSDGEPE